MLKITLTNPNTQATETYDVVKEFNPMFERAKELGLISSIFGLKVKDMKDENAPIRLHADSDVGNGLLRILPENDSLYDVRVTDESVSGVREELHDDLEATGVSLLMSKLYTAVIRRKNAAQVAGSDCCILAYCSVSGILDTIYTVS